jgi:hypothetical protein
MSHIKLKAVLTDLYSRKIVDNRPLFPYRGNVWATIANDLGWFLSKNTTSLRGNHLLQQVANCVPQFMNGEQQAFALEQVANVEYAPPEIQTVVCQHVDAMLKKSCSDDAPTSVKSFVARYLAADAYNYWCSVQNNKEAQAVFELCAPSDVYIPDKVALGANNSQKTWARLLPCIQKQHAHMSLVRDVGAVAACVPKAAKPAIKKTRVSKKAKMLAWHTYIGAEVATSPCMCCKTTRISQMDFHCGHITAVAAGGTNAVENLRPICALCNQSMGVKSMVDFAQEHGFGPISDICVC